MSETIWHKPAEEVGLELHTEPLFGSACLLTLAGMVGNDQEFPCSYIVRWQDHQIWRMEIQPKMSAHLHYQIRVDRKPPISEFTAELRKSPVIEPVNEHESVDRYPWKFVMPPDKSAQVVTELPEFPYPGQRINFMVSSTYQVYWTFEYQPANEGDDE